MTIKDFFEKLRILLLLLADAYETWREHIWRADLDERWCCDGRECGCGAATVRDMWSSVPGDSK